MKQPRLSLFSFVLLLLFSNSAISKSGKEIAVSAPWKAHILRQTEVPTIEGLTFLSKEVVVRLIPHGAELRPLVEIKGRFDRSDAKLQVGGQDPVWSRTDPKDFSVYAYLNSQISEVAFQIKSTSGEPQTEIVYLFAPEAQEFQVVSTWESVSLGLGLSAITYEQSSFGTFKGLSGLLRARYESPDSGRRWSQIADGSLSVWSLHSSPIAANPQVIDGFWALGYRPTWGERGRTRHTITTGIHASAVYSNGSPFGYGMILAPEIGWRAKFYHDTRQTFSGEIRAVLLRNPEFDRQRQFSLRGTWNQTLRSLRQREIGLGLSDLNFETETHRVRLFLITAHLSLSI